VIVGATYGTAIDMWSMACITFELATGDLLFKPKNGNNFSKNDGMLHRSGWRRWCDGNGNGGGGGGGGDDSQPQ
jgi:serine/threonine protein kinase